MSNTSLLNLPEIAESQGNKFVTHNEALRILEVFAGGRVLSRSVSDAQTLTPSESDAWIVARATFAIVGVDTSNEVLRISGDETARFSVGDTLEVSGSTGNDGTYTVSALNYDSGNDETDITIQEDVTDTTADGNILHAGGAFNGHNDEVGVWIGGAFLFVSPFEGAGPLWINDEDSEVRWRGLSWEVQQASAESTTSILYSETEPSDRTVTWIKPGAFNSRVFWGTDDSVYGRIDSDQTEAWEYTDNEGYGEVVDAYAGFAYHPIGYSAGIVKLDMKDGAESWNWHSGASVLEEIICVSVDADGFVYTGDEYDRRYKLKPDGTLDTQLDVERDDATKSVKAQRIGDYVYFGYASGRLKKCNKSDLTEVWGTYPASNIISDIAETIDGTIIATSHDNNVYKIDPDDGSTLATFTGGSDLANAVAISADHEYAYIAYQDNPIRKLRISDLSQVWSVTPDSEDAYAVAVDGDGFVYGGFSNFSTSENLYKLDPVDGSTVWSSALGASKLRALAVDILEDTPAGAYIYNKHLERWDLIAYLGDNAKTASTVPITDDGDRFAGGDVEAALRQLGAVVHLAVESRTSDEPGTPTDGRRYIHNGGTWSVGSAGDVIARIAGAWYVYTPADGWTAKVLDEGLWLEYSESAGDWRDFAGISDAILRGRLGV